jgi:acyl transferase domain-containing protein
MLSKSLSNSSLKGIVIIGMAAWVFGAKNVKEFWHNLAHGIESISTFSDEELIESGVDIGSIRNDSNFARVGGVLS